MPQPSVIFCEIDRATAVTPCSTYSIWKVGLGLPQRSLKFFFFFRMPPASNRKMGSTLWTCLPQHWLDSDYTLNKVSSKGKAQPNLDANPNPTPTPNADHAHCWPTLGLLGGTETAFLTVGTATAVCRHTLFQ